jgi:hypothetical protein
MGFFTQKKPLLRKGVNTFGYHPIWSTRREAMFDPVRLNPFHSMGEGPGPRISAAWLETLNWAVQTSLENGMKVIAGLHEFIATLVPAT